MKKLFLVCCLAAFCTCNAMAQETVDSTMVDSMAIEALPLDNPVTQAIMARRSIRKYLDKPVEHEKLAYLVECGINAPSGSNRQPWVLRVVENQELLAQVNDVFKQQNAKKASKTCSAMRLILYWFARLRKAVVRLTPVCWARTLCWQPSR